MIGNSRRKAETKVTIELLMRRNLVRRTEIDLMLWTAALWECAGVFDVGIPRLRQLPVEVHAGLPGEITPWPLCRPRQ